MDVKAILSQMTLEEKTALLSGLNFWNLKGVERLGVPSVMVTDGPHGLRKQAGEADHLGLNASVPATAFPTAAGLACSFDRELLGQVGEALGDICQQENVAVILGPGANIKRSPLCGRNFEYFSEDPFLAGEMAAAHIQGVQRKNVGTSLKHFAMNNQEHRRMSTSAVVDERTQREIYLPAFETAVKKGKPWTVMCSYNKVNGTYASENAYLLRQLLREEWGFEGFTVTDWGACADHVKSVIAGMDVAMPALGPKADADLCQAVRDGRVPEAIVDEAAGRVLNIIARFVENRRKDPDFSLETQDHLARKVARETAVLLKNDGGLLPLRAGEKIAFIGAYAQTPRYQGGGSSRINAYRVTGALQAVASVAKVAYAQGFDGAKDRPDEKLLADAVALARESEVAVLFIGLPDSFESEGFDRSHMRLPENQLRLIDEVCKVNGKVVVVLHNGSPVELPFADKVQAILEMYLGGQAVGGATVDLLFGAASPSGKLAETFPLRLEDNPSYLSFPGDGDEVVYSEGLYVGYRWYDARRMPVRYPFGYGLSYTTFEYANLRVKNAKPALDEAVEVSVDVTNTGKRAGKEIVQLYVASAHKGISRPEQELKGFEKIALAPGETKTVIFRLERRAFSYWSTAKHDWYAEGSAYEIRVGASSRDIRCRAAVELAAEKPVPICVTPDTTFGDLLSIPGSDQVLAQLLQGMASFGGGDASAMGEGGDDMMKAMMRYMPLHGLMSFAPDQFTAEAMHAMIDALNAIQK